MPPASACAGFRYGWTICSTPESWLPDEQIRPLRRRPSPRVSIDRHLLQDGFQTLLTEFDMPHRTPSEQVSSKDLRPPIPPTFEGAGEWRVSSAHARRERVRARRQFMTSDSRGHRGIDTRSDEEN